MFCQKCGTSMVDAAVACPSCNTPVAKGGTAATSAAVADTVKAAYGSGLAALKGFMGDPVGKLPATYDALGDDKARRIGITYGVVSMLCFLIGGYLLIPFRDGLLDNLGFGGVLKCLLFGVVPFGCLAVGGMATRKVFGGQGGTGGDLFIAGAALLPTSLAMLVNGMLGYSNAGMMGAVSIFAGCTAVLMLFSGYSRISKLSERATTLAIPIVVILTMWIGQSLGTSLLESAFLGNHSNLGGGGFMDFGG